MGIMVVVDRQQAKCCATAPIRHELHSTYRPSINLTDKAHRHHFFYGFCKGDTQCLGHRYYTWLSPFSAATYQTGICMSTDIRSASFCPAIYELGFKRNRHLGLASSFSHCWIPCVMPERRDQFSRSNEQSLNRLRVFDSRQISSPYH